DNIDITPGVGKTIATDDIGGVHHPYVKLEFGGADSATPVSPTNPIPVTNMLDGSLKNTAATITTGAAQVVSSALSNRRGVMIQNLGTDNVYVGGSTVSTSNGIRITPDATSPIFPFGPDVAIYMVADSG